MSATIKQIAAAAGVSRGTVDRVLHNRSGVKPEIAVHVRQIAKDLGYEPNRAGRILAAVSYPQLSMRTAAVYFSGCQRSTPSMTFCAQ